MGEASRRLWIRVPRSALALLFFLAFGVGGLVLGCLLFPPLALFRARRAMRALVRACYRLFVWAARATGMIRVVLSAEDRARLAAMRGCVVVASHPTLIDVVVLLSLLPDATAVAKAAAGRNFFYSRVVRAAFLVNDNPQLMLDAAKGLLADGVNLAIFPEGTRTPADASGRKLHRGAAQIALYAGVPVQCVSYSYLSTMSSGIVQWAKTISPVSGLMLEGLAWKPEMPSSERTIIIDSMAGTSPSQPAT